MECAILAYLGSPSRDPDTEKRNSGSCTYHSRETALISEKAKTRIFKLASAPACAPYYQRRRVCLAFFALLNNGMLVMAAPVVVATVRRLALAGTVGDLKNLH